MVTLIENLAEPLKNQRFKKLLKVGHYHRNIQWRAIFDSALYTLQNSISLVIQETIIPYFPELFPALQQNKPSKQQGKVSRLTDQRRKIQGHLRSSDIPKASHLWQSICTLR